MRLWVVGVVCRALEVLSDLVSGKEEMDMERMNNLIKRQLLTILDHVRRHIKLPHAPLFYQGTCSGRIIRSFNQPSNVHCRINCSRGYLLIDTPLRFLSVFTNQ